MGGLGREACRGFPKLRHMDASNINKHGKVECDCRYESLNVICTLSALFLPIFNVSVREWVREGINAFKDVLEML